MSYDERIDEDALAWWCGNPRAVLKFVAIDASDVAEVQGLLLRMHALTGRVVDPSRVWIMPEGRTPHDVDRHARYVAEAAVAAGFNMTTRLHVQLWGQERGR